MKHKLAIACFLLLISLPLALFVLGVRGSNIDNRAATPLPQISWQGIRSASWFAQMNAWLIERTPLRPAAVRANSRVDLHVFGTSSNPNVSVGSGGWLFFNGGLDQPCLDKAEITRRLSRLAETAAHYRTAHGTRIVWVIAPDKEAIYPEQLTALQASRAACATANRATMRDLLADAAFAPHVLGLWDSMEQHREENIYRRTDSHWNHLGASYAVQTMISRLWPKLEVQSHLTPTHAKPYEGDLAKMLGLTALREEEMFWSHIHPSHESPDPLCITQGTPRLKSYRHSGASLVPEKVVILRDSFFDAPLQLVPPFFAQVDIGHIDHTPKADWPAIARCADTLVVESVERHALERMQSFADALSGR